MGVSRAWVSCQETVRSIASTVLGASFVKPLTAEPHKRKLVENVGFRNWFWVFVFLKNTKNIVGDFEFSRPMSSWFRKEGHDLCNAWPPGYSQGSSRPALYSLLVGKHLGFNTSFQIFLIGTYANPQGSAADELMEINKPMETQITYGNPKKTRGDPKKTKGNPWTTQTDMIYNQRVDTVTHARPRLPRAACGGEGSWPPYPGNMILL